MYRLVIADDEALIRAGLLYRNNWNEMGFEVVASLEDGSDVLEFLEKERVDVVLADICMYSVSGLEVAKVIQKKYPWMKVVLLSVYQEFEYAKEAMYYNVYDYLLKPVDYDKLREVFAKIKKELDGDRQTELLISQFGENEYELTIQMLKKMSLGENGAEKEKWRAYENMRQVIHNAPTKMSALMAKELLDSLLGKLLDLDTVLAQQFSQELQDLNELHGKEEHGKTLLECLTQLNEQLIECNMFAGPKNNDESIVKACRYIKKHLGHELTLESVAEQVHLSARHFSRRFTVEMGERFHTYLHRVRMEEAIRLLREGKLMTAEISEAVGYDDDKYFQKLFKKYTGYTVREFQRRKNLEGAYEADKND